MPAFICLSSSAVPQNLADKINNLLPQTQCTKCGYPACKAYAEAIANEQANFNQCPPGGQEGVARLAIALNKAIAPLNPENGLERPRPVAFIDKAVCIGCTLCIQACPVDAIMGANKLMHTVIPELCTGCDLCVAPCPVDCITMLPTTNEQTGWEAWSQTQADAARARYEARERRLVQEKEENDARLLAKAEEKFRQVLNSVPASPEEDGEKARKQKIISEAIARATAKKIASTSLK
ncbi:MAG: electron transport complex subunit RsxB [Undibacterium sp.]|nr:electron transport complex subunit RsxB [Undibacterium sp.]